MALRINQNVTSLSTYGNLNRASGRIDSSIKKLSSGLRINSAADDAAGLSISEKMRSQITGLNRAKLNAQDGVSMIQTAEGGLNETESIIQRMRELAVQASNDTLTSNDRLEIQKEVNQLTSAINDISDSTEFNTKKLLNGSQTAQISSSSNKINGMVTGTPKSGGDYSVDMKVVQGGISQMQTTQLFRDKNTGELAKGSTKLEDVAQFYDQTGTFALATPQTLTVTGNAKSAEVTIDGKMTLNELSSALQGALAGSSQLDLKNTRVQYKDNGNNVADGGYIQLTSGVVGEEGNFSIAGDQAVIDALGISVSRESANNVVEATIKDNSGNVRTVKTSSDRLTGLLDGIDVQFESSAAQIGGNGGIVDGLKFGAVSSNLKFVIKSDAASAGVTVNAKFAGSAVFSMEGIAKAINNEINKGAAKSFGVSAAVVDGQIRLSYNPTNVNAPASIEVSEGNDTLGISAGTYSGFVDGDKDMSAAIKGMSQVASAADAMDMTVSDGKNSYVITLGTGIIASTVNSAGDMVEINGLVKKVNDAMVVNSVNVRMDAVNGSVAFTSTILGQTNAVDGSAQAGKVVLTDGTTTATQGALNRILNISNGAAKGAGDTNFRLHVVDNSSSLQIGANQGQQMSFTIGDMSAKALDIDKLDMSTSDGAQSAIGKLDNALSKVSAERSKLGSYSNRLAYTMNNLESAATNLTDAESRIRDLDMAAEMTKFSSSQVLQQAATSMLAQANSASQSVLKLIG